MRLFTEGERVEYHKKSNVGVYRCAVLHDEGRHGMVRLVTLTAQGAFPLGTIFYSYRENIRYPNFDLEEVE